MDFSDFISTVANIASTVFLGMSLLVGWTIALRAQAREKILDAKESIRSLAQIFFETSEEALATIGRDMYFRRPRFSSWKKSRWDITIVVCNRTTRNVDVSFVFSNATNKSVAIERAMSTVSTKMNLYQSEKTKIDGRVARETQISYDLDDILVVLFVLDKKA